MGELNTRRIAAMDALIKGRMLQTCGKDFEQEREHWLTDTLADLMHWAHANGQDFDAALSTATMHFSEERNEDE